MKKILVSAALSAALLSGSVFAQEDANAEPDSTVEATAEIRQKPRQLDEVVVTAQKRSQNIKEVPISVSTISGDDLKDLNVENMNDLSKVTPNLKISADGVYNVISIRGLGSGVNGGFDQSVGIFIDDVYYSSPQRLIAAMFDIERIEVLRGPQGTLFGRNTIAGAISIHTGTVDHEWGLKIDSTMGELDWNKHTLIVNAPIVEDVLATRLAGQYFKRDGHVYDRLFDTPNGTQTLKSLRAKFRYTVSDDLDFEFTVQHQDSLGKGQGDQYHHVPDEWLTFFRVFDPQTEQNLDDYAHATNFYSGGNAITYDYLGKANFRMLGHDWVFLTAYSENESVGGVDADFGPSPMILGLGGGNAETINSELRIVSDPGTIEYVAGLYYFWNDKYNLTDIVVAPFLGTGVVQDLLVPEALQALTAGLFPIIGPFNQETRRTEFAQVANSYAIYGQATWNIGEKLSLIAGARFSMDEKELDFVATHYTVGDQPGPAPVQEQLLNAEEFDVQDTRDDTSFTPKLSAIYRITDEINIYATWAQGFKAGGFNAAASNLNGELQFEPEFSNTYEAGVKGDYFGGAARFNVGFFRTEFEDLQVSVFNGLDFVVDNAAEAISQGIEIDGMMLLPAGFLLTTTFSWLDAYYESFPEGPCQTQAYTESSDDGDFCDLTGAPLAGTPEFQFTLGVNYLNQLGNMPFDLIVGVDYYWQDDVLFSTDQDPEDFQEAYALVGARIGLRDDNGIWSFTIFGRNLTDETVLISSFDVPLFAGAHVGSVEPPRTITANFTLEF